MGKGIFFEEKLSSLPSIGQRGVHLPFPMLVMPIGSLQSFPASMAFEIRQRKEEMLQVDYRFFKRRNEFRSPMSREAAYTAAPAGMARASCAMFEVYPAQRTTP